MFRCLVPLILAAMLVFSYQIAFAQVDKLFEAAIFTEGEQKLPYRLMKPEGYDGTKGYPLVVFLHGAGERGDDNRAQLKHFVGALASEDARKKFPCFVLAPQCPAGKKWSEVNWGAKSHTQPEQPSTPAALLLKLMDKLEGEYKIDKGRRYAIGLSMGGYGVWDLIARHPDKFAAAVPICGGGDEATAPRIAKLPIWAFHGEKDGTVKPERTRNMIEALHKAGGEPKYTELPGVGHDSWTPASRDPELFPWLFGQHKG